MPKVRKGQLVIGRYYKWVVIQRHGVYYADGRAANPINLGRQSLGTKDYDEALANLQELDLKMAVQHGQADPSTLATDGGLRVTLEDGRAKYLEYEQRPPVRGGVRSGSVKRYRAVLHKFLAFAAARGTTHWSQVNRAVLDAYVAWLEEEGYALATEYLELTVLQQVRNWLIEEKLLPEACRFTYHLQKPQGTSTYCYTAAEVRAMVDWCAEDPERAWLGAVILALAHTGLRISELAALRWSDLDWDKKQLHLFDNSRRGDRRASTTTRTTKGGRDRTLPIHKDLAPALRQLQQGRHPDGRIFHGPRSGALKPDTVRKVLQRDVLQPLAPRFSAPPGTAGLEAGRLHSFRHYFCSVSANAGVPEQVLMEWLGHRDSRMVRHYYHLLDDESQRQMQKIQFVGGADAA